MLVDIAEHHANIVPWQMLSERHGIIVERIDLDENYDYSLTDFTKKYTDGVKVVSISAASNVTGVLYDIAAIATKLRPETFFIVDGSQAIPHGPIDVVANRIDALIFTGHKIMADSGL
ncbi:aminotransferase class V-fold PLP-dependent enzyme [Patescibacteria group bacterium]|nr:aminotransferase class V-fold PLP-dependent enzyme [Patescibacteria group bacterium]